MPSGRVHDNIAIISAIPLFLVGNYLIKYNLPQTYILIWAALFSQYMFGPDLDSHSIQYKRWGILKWIWIPYRKIFTHRSRFSHGIILGPIVRFIYLIGFFAIMLSLSRLFINFISGFDILPYFAPKLGYIIIGLRYIEYSSFLLPIILGLFIGAAIHTLTDKVVSFFNNLV